MDGPRHQSSFYWAGRAAAPLFLVTRTTTVAGAPPSSVPSDELHAGGRPPLSATTAVAAFSALSTITGPDR